ncbi:MAG TPA: hypothetical protein VIN07_00870 [Flavipsychrobacter sp.]
MILFRKTIVALFSLSLFVLACKSSKKTQSSAMAEEVFVPVSNIALYDKPLDTIKKHVTGQRWQLIYSTGGMTGDQMNRFDNTYYTLTKTGKLITEKDGKIEEAPYTWEETRDIFTGNKTHVISGVVFWKVEGIYNDTLRLSDNYADGFGYALIRSR